ncbi:hypothetical protein SmJEL517_g05668 [Synchytrium microbalum]|uniref:Calcineurin-like phosphoesterase domain-containing protein n=1 Tax=Synchytrium microbalum TaxID=1806994 RepID=A0A507BZW9_9FUNG|nr:uncharacterized protein SmJEL517_g05668 [Synchytrium microbalum]TPX30885.1 hypothetical protein SmJEL517_g05668 [Synchytrium microbalum]
MDLFGQEVIFKPDIVPPPVILDQVKIHNDDSSLNSADIDPSPPRRIIAVGDLHSDLPNTLKVLKFAGIIDDNREWIAQSEDECSQQTRSNLFLISIHLELDTTLVQTGDVVDRGPDTKELFALMRRLTYEAPKFGSDVVALLGNHEVMNMQNDLRYVTEEDFASFGGREPRAKDFSTSGDLGQYLRSLDLVAKVNGTVFCHGGITPHWAKVGISTINQSARRSLFSRTPEEGSLNPVFGADGPLWDRSYAQEDEKTICSKLTEALREMNARRMVVGHTPQLAGIKSRCRGRVVLIDVGISKAYGGRLSALELFADSAHAIYEGPIRVKLPRAKAEL